MSRRAKLSLSTEGGEHAKGTPGLDDVPGLDDADVPDAEFPTSSERSPVQTAGRLIPILLTAAVGVACLYLLMRRR